MGGAATEGPTYGQALSRAGLIVLAAHAFAFLLYRGWLPGRGSFSGAENRHAAFDFYTVYLLEASLSLDNLFAFFLVFKFFRVTRSAQSRVLYWGIAGAIVLRATMIGVGAALVGRFQSVMLVFAAILVYQGAKLALMGDDDDDDGSDMGDNRIVRLAQVLVPVTASFHGDRFFVRVPASGVPGRPQYRDTCTGMVDQQNPRASVGSSSVADTRRGGAIGSDGTGDDRGGGRDAHGGVPVAATVTTWRATPLLLVLFVIEFSDVVFAVDSVPAALGVTRHGWIIFSANMFDIAALRSLYPIVAKLVNDLPLLQRAVGLVLCFIGGKVVAEFFAGKHVSTGHSLLVVGSLLLCGAAASVWQKQQHASAGHRHLGKFDGVPRADELA